jgi:hypothetical protein
MHNSSTQTKSEAQTVPVQGGERNQQKGESQHRGSVYAAAVYLPFLPLFPAVYDPFFLQ